MTSVDSIYGLYQAASTTSTDSTDSTALDSTAFLELFLVQLENQDPTDPMDTNDLSSQLCSYSQLEQAMLTNDYLSEQSGYQQAMFNAEAAQLIGESIVIEGNSINKEDGEIGSIVLELDSALSDATISIFDEEGNQVATLNAEDLSEGMNTINWDGLGDDGQEVEDGEYTYTVATTSSENADVGITSYMTSEVLSVLFQDNEALLLTASGDEVNYTDVTQVM